MKLILCPALLGHCCVHLLMTGPGTARVGTSDRPSGPADLNRCVALDGLLALLLKGIDGMWDEKELESTDCVQRPRVSRATTRISDRPGAVPVCCWGPAADAREKGPRAFRLPTVAAEIEWGSTGAGRGLGATRRSPCKLLKSVLLQRI